MEIIKLIDFSVDLDSHFDYLAIINRTQYAKPKGEHE